VAAGNNYEELKFCDGGYYQIANGLAKKIL